MAAVHGKTTVIYVSGIAETLYTKAYTIATSVETADNTDFGTGSDARTYITGLQAGTVSVEGFWERGLLELNMQAQMGSATKQVVNVLPSGDSAGGICYGILSDHTSYSQESPVDGIVTVEFEGQGSTRAERLHILHPAANRTSSGSGSDIDTVVSTISGGSAYLQVTAVNVASKALSCTLVGSNDSFSSHSAVIATFTSTSAVGGERISWLSTTYQTMRLDYDMTAGGDFSFFVAAGHHPLT